MKSNKKILVTGATGFVGANLIRRLLKEGYNVSILTRKHSDKWRIKEFLKDIDEYKVDLLEPKKLGRTVKKIKPYAIFHLANQGIYGGISLPDKKLIEVNFLGFINLVSACSDIDYKYFINTGSSSEYGPKDRKMCEDHVCQPVDVYGLSKCAATMYATFKAKIDNRNISTMRLFSPFGAFDDKRRLISYAILNCLRNSDLKLADPYAVRDYIFIDDVCDLYIKAINGKHSFHGDIFNVGIGKQTKLSFIVKEIKRITGSKSRLLWNSIKPRHSDNKKWEADISKTVKFFNWKPKHSVKEGLRNTVDWFKEHQSLYY